MKMGFFGLFKKKKEPELPPIPQDVQVSGSSNSSMNQSSSVPQIPSISGNQSKIQSNQLQSNQLTPNNQQQSNLLQSTSNENKQSAQPSKQILTQKTHPTDVASQVQSAQTQLSMSDIQQTQPADQSKSSMPLTHYVSENTLFLEISNYRNLHSNVNFVKRSFETLDKAVELAIESEDFENTVGDFIKNIEEMNRTILQIDKKYFYEE